MAREVSVYSLNHSKSLLATIFHYSWNKQLPGLKKTHLIFYFEPRHVNSKSYKIIHSQFHPLENVKQKEENYADSVKVLTKQCVKLIK